MNRHNIYIITTIVIGLLIIGLLGWAIFVSKKEEQYAKDASIEHFSSYDNGKPIAYNQEMFGKPVSTTSTSTSVADSVVVASVKPIKEVDLVQLYTTPVAGVSVVVKNDVERLRLSEMTTGHIFDIRIEPDVEVSRVMQTTVPRTQKAIFAQDGSWVVRQYLDSAGDIKTIYNKIVQESKVSAEDVRDVARGVFLEDGITSITYSPIANKLFYIVPVNDGVNGVLINPDGTEREVIWSTFLRGWNAYFVNEHTIALVQYSANGMDGLVYLLDTNTKKTITAFSSLPGVLALFSTDANTAVYATYNKQYTQLRIHNFKTATDVILALPTIPEKCVWGVGKDKTLYCAVPKQFLAYEYPDDWYQGKVHFSDVLWKIDTITGKTEEIVSFEDRFNVPIDAIDLKFGSDGKHLFLKNKTDQTLWMLTLPQKEDTSGVDKKSEVIEPVSADEVDVAPATTSTTSIE